MNASCLKVLIFCNYKEARNVYCSCFHNSAIPLTVFILFYLRIDYSNRMCAHTGAQEGTEKKQAASGTSTSRGTRKKSVRSSTRRRSTRNSKSDTTLQNSPKSSSSDHDTPGYNTTTDNSSSDPPAKPPSKQRKQAPKKGSQTRKRLRSATKSQEDSKDDKNDSESEQEKKCKMSEDDLSETEVCKINQSPNSSNEGECLQADMSSPTHSEEKPLLDSSPGYNVQSADKESLASPDLHTQHEFDIEHSVSSPLLKNGQTDSEDSQSDLPKSVNEPSGIDSAANQPDIEGEPSCESQNLNVSDEQSSSSFPELEKHTNSDPKDLPPLSCDKVEQVDDAESTSSPSSSPEMKSPTKKFQDLPLSEESDVNEENHLHTTQINLKSNESHSESSEKSTVSLDLVKSYDLDSTPSCDASKEESIQKPQNIQELGTGDALKDMHRQDEQEKVLEVNLQTAKQECIGEQDTKTSVTTSELDDQNNSDCSVNREELSEPSLALSKHSAAADGLSDTGEIPGNVLCTEEIKSPILEDGKIHDTNGKTNLKIDQKTFSEDNVEPVAMECDSVCSDHDSEVEQSVDITDLKKSESDTLAANLVPQSPPKPLLPSDDTQKKESRIRKSRFHSPSTTWSPSKNDVKERPKSRSRSPVTVKDSPVKRKSRSRSRDRDGERLQGGQWKGRSRDRHHRRHSRSKSRHSRSRSKPSRSKSKSRSRSGSRTRYRNRSVTIDKNEKDGSPPPWKERRSNENWKSPRGSEKYRRNEPDRHENYDARDSADAYPDNKNDYPDWVVEKMKSADSRGRGDTWTRGEGRGRGDRGWGDARGRGDRARGRGEFRARGENRGRGDRGGRGGSRGGRASHWEEDDSWNRNVNMDWNSPRSRGGRGRGGFRGGLNYGDQIESWNRPPYSGNSTFGQESSRFPESKHKYEDSFDSPADRSGWSSASSWAVRKTLPADVQNYYSKKGRNPTGSQGGVWPRPEESQDQGLFPNKLILPRNLF